MPVKEPTNRARHGPMTWKQGDPILARDLSAMADQVFRVLEGGRGIKVNKMGNGVIVSSTAQRARGGVTGASNPVRFAKFSGFSGIGGVTGDIIICNFYDPVTDVLDSAELWVAMPWMLRRLPFDNKTIDYPSSTVSYIYSNAFIRDATEDEATRQQIITPNYYRGEVIRLQHGATGLSSPLDGKPIVWEDVNTCGRFWAEELT